MNVVLINKSDKIGGAAIACKRLFHALLKQSVNAKLLVQQGRENEDHIINLEISRFQKMKNLLLFILERLYFLFFERSKEIRFAFSPAKAGLNIAKRKELRNADIIHLHWFNQGFLSLKNIKKLVELQKPIVWTLHDMWAFTGGCHYSGTCVNYRKNCGNCPFLKKPFDKDLSYKIFQKKREIYGNANITFVTCSKWMKKQALQSALLKDFRIVDIPNPISRQYFKSQDKNLIRPKYQIDNHKKVILFAAANIEDKRKGFQYLLDAIFQLFAMKLNFSKDIEILVFGKSNHNLSSEIPFSVKQLGILHNEKEIAAIFAMADVFVLPSLEDNLPNTVMEALACGTPVIAFNTGGLPEMIEHKINGYLAEYKSSADLAEGIKFILNHPEPKKFNKNALLKVEKEYREDVVAKKYNELYRDLLR